MLDPTPHELRSALVSLAIYSPETIERMARRFDSEAAVSDRDMGRAPGATRVGMALVATRAAATLRWALQEAERAAQEVNRSLAVAAAAPAPR